MDKTFVLEMSPEEVSLAWEFLCNDEKSPPKRLEHLSKEQWLALSEMLEQTMEEKEYGWVH
ncbi:hypothetical protein D3C86_1024360 [compost metagenome]